MVLMDLPELSPLRLWVRAGGVFIATILHPAFFLQKTVDEEGGGGYRQVRGYLEDEAWWIEGFGGHWHHHRPLSAYVSWLSGCGLGVIELLEPEPTVYEGWRRNSQPGLALPHARLMPDRDVVPMGQAKRAAQGLWHSPSCQNDWWLLSPSLCLLLGPEVAKARSRTLRISLGDRWPLAANHSVSARGLRLRVIDEDGEQVDQHIVHLPAHYPPVIRRGRQQRGLTLKAS